MQKILDIKLMLDENPISFYDNKNPGETGDGGDTAQHNRDYM